MKQFGVGILGCGKMGHIYASYFSKNEHCRFVAVYNRTLSSAEKIASSYPGIRVCKKWEDLVTANDIDIIGICTPSSEHMAQMELSIKCGKHILCEKPMARNIDECRHMVRLTENYNKKVMVGFQMRFHPVITKVDEIIKSIGRVYHIDFVFGMYRPESDWRHKIEQHGGVLKELGCHLFDLAIHWCGTVSAVTGLNRIIQSDREVEDYSLNLIEFKNGVTGYLFCNYHDRRSRIIKGNIIGTQGQIEWQFSPYEPQDSRIILFTDSNRTDVPISMPEHIDENYPGHLDSFEKEINHFVDCILYAHSPLVGCYDGMVAIEIIDVCYESQRKNTKINLPLQRFSTEEIELCFRKYYDG